MKRSWKRKNRRTAWRDNEEKIEKEDRKKERTENWEDTEEKLEEKIERQTGEMMKRADRLGE